MRRQRAQAAIVSLAVLVASRAGAAGVAGRLVFLGAPAQVGIGDVTPVFTIQRQDPDGGPLDVGQPAMTVLITSSSDGGIFANDADPFLTWVSAFPVSIPAGQSVSGPISYSDTQVGTAVLAADGGSNWTAAASVAVSPTTVSDDFESGDLSRWDDVLVNSGWTLVADPAAAHRGQFGLRAVDTGQCASTCESARAGVQFPVPIEGDYYARAWVRVSGAAGSGTPYFLNNVVAVLGHDSNAWNIELGSQHFLSVAPLADGSWHLLELETTGAGTSSGAINAWIDGTVRLAWGTLDLSARSFQEVSFGEPVVDAPWSGTIDVDDARAGVVPFASKLVLVPEFGTVVQGACAPLAIQLATSDGPAANAPYDVVANLSATGVPGAWFSDAQCSRSTSTVTISNGTTSQMAYYLASAPGTATLGASHLDFIQGTTTLTVVPAGAGDGGFTDGGVNDGGLPAGGAADGGRGPITLAIGCGCEGVDGGFAFAALLAICLWAGRRWRCAGN